MFLFATNFSLRFNVVIFASKRNKGKTFSLQKKQKPFTFASNILFRIKKHFLHYFASQFTVGGQYSRKEPFEQLHIGYSEYLQMSGTPVNLPITVGLWEFSPELWEDPWSSSQGVSHTEVLSHTHILFLHFV